MFNEYRPKHYNLSDLALINSSLKDLGYAVVRIPSIDLNHLSQLFSSDMSSIIGYDLHLDELWDKNVELPTSSYPGLFGEYGLSQGDAAWYVRTNKDIINLYKKILDVNNVVCSMDAIGFTQDDVYLDNVTWLHVDQNPYVLGGDFKSIQGIFYAEDSYGERAGTVVVPGSHKDFTIHNYRNSHFTIVEQDRYIPNAVKLNISAGSLLLFNSKLVHQGFNGPHRLCFMICYGDEKLRDDETRKSKIVMYLSGQRSNHWSQFAVHHGWKWQHGDRWNMLVPKTTVDTEYQNDMIDDECANPAIYIEDMDFIIPKERLELL